MSHFITGVIINEPKSEVLKNIIDKYDYEYEDLDGEYEIVRTKKKIIEDTKKLKQDFIAEKSVCMNSWREKIINAETDEELYEAGKNNQYEFDEDGNEIDYSNKNAKFDFCEVVKACKIAEISDKEKIIQELFCFIDENGWKATNSKYWYIRDTKTDEAKEFEKYVESVLNENDNQERYLVLLNCHF